MNSQSPTEYMSKGTISTYWIYEAAFYTEHWPFLPRLNVRWEDKLDELGQPQGRVTADSAGYWNSLCRAFWMPCSVHQDTRLQKAANKFDERGWSPASSYKRTGASCSDMCQVSEQGFRQNWTNNRIYLQLAQCRVCGYIKWQWQMTGNGEWWNNVCVGIVKEVAAPSLIYFGIVGARLPRFIWTVRWDPVRPAVLTKGKEAGRRLPVIIQQYWVFISLNVKTSEPQNIKTISDAKVILCWIGNK